MSAAKMVPEWKLWMRRLMPYLPFAVLWAAFLAFGLHVRSLMPWTTSVNLHGLDYGWHGLTFSDYRYIGMASFRHPLLGVFTAPLSLFGQRLAELGVWPCWCFQLAVFAAVMAGSAFFVCSTLKAVDGVGRCEATAGAALFASFSYTWMLAACPESFPLACLALLATLRWGLSPRSSGSGWTARAGWLGVAVLNGGITLSNVAKVGLAFLTAHGFTRKRLVRIVQIGTAIAAMTLAVFLVRYVIFRITHGEWKSTLSDGVSSSISHIHGFDLHTYLSLAVNFFSEPIITHGDQLTENIVTRPYCTILAPLSVATLYAAAIIGAWRARRTPLVRMALAMFSVDFVLHIVMLWGLDEGQIYCGHWLFTPALFAALLPATLAGRMRLCANVMLFLLAAAIFACGALSFATGAV